MLDLLLQMIELSNQEDAILSKVRQWQLLLNTNMSSLQVNLQQWNFSLIRINRSLLDHEEMEGKMKLMLDSDSYTLDGMF